MCCDNCKYYIWYWDKCTKWGCIVDAREVHNCFEPISTPIYDYMVGKGGDTEGAERSRNNEKYKPSA